MSRMKNCLILRNIKRTYFTFFELLRESQQGGRVKISPPKLRLNVVFDFLTFLGGIEMEHWAKMNYIQSARSRQ